MRLASSLSCLSYLLLAACSPTPVPEVDTSAPTAIPKVAAEANQRPETVALPLPLSENGNRVPLRWVSTRVGDIKIDALVYDRRDYEAIIADQPGGPASKWATAKDAAEAAGAIGAINAGFFTPEGTPLGLVVTSGQVRGQINRSSSLGSGFYVIGSNRVASLVRRDSYRPSPEALQTGPFLVEKGRAVGGLSEKSSSARSFIATDGQNGWVIARTGPCSLRQLSTSLAGKRLGGVAMTNALNLDGGRSSDLWISRSVPGGPREVRPMWNKPVRNFLIVRKTP